MWGAWTAVTPLVSAELKSDVDQVLEALIYLYTESRRLTKGIAREVGLTGPQLTVIKLLETFGCNVSLVTSAGEALERIEEGADVDLVFSDVVMPDIDGLEFAERLNELRPGLPVIFCTGYTSAVEALTDCGAMALMKPYSADVLERVVSERLQVARGSNSSD